MSNEQLLEALVRVVGIVATINERFRDLHSINVSH